MGVGGDVQEAFAQGNAVRLSKCTVPHTTSGSQPFLDPHEHLKGFWPTHLTTQHGSRVTWSDGWAVCIFRAY